MARNRWIDANPAERQKGNIMKKTFKYEEIEKILADADDLLKQTDPEVIEYMEEEQRLKLARHAQNLKKLKSEVQGRIGKADPAQSGSFSDGVHQAVDEIVKAMKTMGNYLS